MKHLVLSNAWIYNPTVQAYKISFGVRNLECAFVPLVDIKPIRQTIATDGQGNFQLVGGDCSGHIALSVLALPQDQFGYIRDTKTGDLMLLKQNTSGSGDCLLFAGGGNCTFVDRNRTSGSILCEYHRSVETDSVLEFVAHLCKHESVIVETSAGAYIEYTWDGRVLIQREI